MTRDRPPAGPSSAWLWPVAGALGCLALGVASGWSTAGGDGVWYGQLVKPPGTPPSWVFGPVWTVLYLMMGVSLGRLIHRKAWCAVSWFGAQFFLNLMWTPVFFGWKHMGLGLVVIGALCLTLAGTMVLAARQDRWSRALLVPYLLWVCYAAYLNAAIFWLNPLLSKFP
jgi:benzodiazapine receptor